jgi:acetyltransferase-like isoleucine patch superfamily enzyme
MRRLRSALGTLVLTLRRDGERGAVKLFSWLAAGGFAAFGPHSRLHTSVRTTRERHIALGADVWVGAGCWLHVLEGSAAKVALEIGDGTSLAGNCTLSATHSLRVGRDVLFARGVYVSDHSHAFEDPTVPVIRQGISRVAPVEIADGAWLGENVVVCPGVRIGRNAVIGANAVVTADVPDRAVAVGAPARVIRILGEVREHAA